MLDSQVRANFPGKYEFSVLIGNRTSVQYMVRLIALAYKKIRRKRSREPKENINFPHIGQNPHSPKILIFLENLIELKF